MIDEMPECYRKTERKARVAHRCCECHGEIKPGELYFYHSGIWAGEPSSYKICCDCEKLRTEIDATISDRWDQLAFGELQDWVFESDPQNGLMVPFIEIKRKRGAAIPEWMRLRIER